MSIESRNYLKGGSIGGRSLIFKLINSKKQPIKLWYYKEPLGANFGDEVTLDIICKLFGYRCQWVPIHECEMIATGSILEVPLQHQHDQTIKVWGSGLQHEKKEHEQLDLTGLIFFAVRGKLTRNRVKIPELVVGDPGLLASLIYKKSAYKTDKIGFIAHYMDCDVPIVKKIEKDSRFKLINPFNTPKQIAHEITKCRLVLSSSLHGLIFSDSFGVPNIHIQLSNRVVGGKYKFKDYCSGIGKKYSEADVKWIFDDDYLDGIIKSYQPVKGLERIQRDLVLSFPF